MSKRPLPYFLVAAALMALAPPVVHAAAPNVLIFFIDDLGYTDLGVYGSSFYRTPKLDELAAGGARLTAGYAACAVCSPTRASLQSGKYPRRVGITNWISDEKTHLEAAELTIAEAFKAAGYRTGYIGKWHLGEQADAQPGNQGYEWTFGVNLAGQPGSYYFPFKRKAGEASKWDVPDMENGAPGDYLTDKLTDAAIDFVRKPADKPFFLCFAHYAMHTPIQPPQKEAADCAARAADLFKEKAKPIAEHFASSSRSRQDGSEYAAMMENLDSNIGRVLKALDESGQRQNTIILFTGDNGGLCTLQKGPGPTSNLPLRSGKGWNYEGGIRVPTIFSWPGTLKPAVLDTPFITMDIYPTLLDLCGLPLHPEQHVDGQSYADLLRAGAPPAERTLAWDYPHRHGSGHRPSYSVRRGKWKLLHIPEENIIELYDLSTDLGEHHDVSKDHPELVDQLRQAYAAWLARTPLPTP